MTEIIWPVLVIEDDGSGFPPVGVPKLEFDGKELVFPTLRSWQIEMSDDDITTLTIHLPVRVEVRPKA